MGWRSAAVRLGKVGVVAGTAVDRAAIRAQTPEPVDEDERYRALWTAAAEVLGGTVHAMWPFLRVDCDGRSAWLFRQETDLDGVTTLRLAADKPAVHALLSGAGVPVPPHLVFDAARPAAARPFLEQHGRCVVKPAAGSARGHGVTTGVSTPKDLARAALAAARWDRRVLIEPHLDGGVHRLLFLDGRLLDTVLRRPPVLTGDGRSTVRQLAAAGRLAVDHDMALALGRQGLALRSVPDAGRTFTAHGVVGGPLPAERVPVKPETADTAGRAVKALGLRLAGVDVIGDVVLEVNGTPGLLVHERDHAVEVLRAALR
ncbi:MAG TPA: hypothetical protein VGO92_02575 [Acidimicrobiales bacterium]|jgi:cyanophycin synthetase|nr:hypothetical protein [Acidimicrobiales bacterium]